VNVSGYKGSLSVGRHQTTLLLKSSRSDDEHKIIDQPITVREIYEIIE
jgi:hypothetical protein